MLNGKNERELAYLVKIDNITAIPGYDRVELAHVSGWTIVVGKGDFQIGDPAVYFEIDSKLPEVDPFIKMEFLAKKKFKIQTQKMCKSISQGFLVAIKEFGWTVDGENVIDEKGNAHSVDGESRFLTAQLGVTYAVVEDNKRKSNSMGDKYKKMAQRHPDIFKKPLVRWLYKRNWGKKLLFVFFGKKKDKVTWPSWVVKTDEERVQNMPWILENKDSWIATEKIDGTSTTFTLKKGKGKNKDYFVCSRNVVFDTPEKADKCFYDSNVYLEMSEKYNMRAVLEGLMDENKNIDFVTIQGETYGKTIQKREYGLEDHNLMVFNLIFGFKNGKTLRLNPVEMTAYLKPYNVPCVPIVDSNFVLPDTVEELLAIATGASVVDGGMREGLVFRSYDGQRSFKAVSNEFLLKYHQ